MFDSFNNCLIVVRYGFNLVFVVRMVLDVRLNWLYDVKKVQRHPIPYGCHLRLAYCNLTISIIPMPDRSLYPLSLC